MSLKMWSKNFVVCLMACVAMLVSSMATAQVKITVNKGTREPITIAISDFAVTNTTALQVSQSLAQVIRNDLQRSGLFKIVPQDTYPETPNEIAAGPTMDAWKVTSARAMSGGKTTFLDDGRLRIEFQLWDIAQGRELEGLAFSTQPQNWRRIAHLAADKIYEQLTGTPGMFDSRIVYVAESGPKTARIKQLAIMDQDGGNQQILTQPGTLVLTPRFSPNSQEITYLSYAGDFPRVMLYNLNTRQQAILGDFPGMSFAPRFSPDGNQVIFSLAVDGNTDIFVMDLRTGNQRQLTSSPSIDTSPSFSPDGREVVFETDRDGKQQLYIMDASGGNQRRISFDDGSYGTPVWSPSGEWIAFTRQHQGEFSVGIMKPNGSDKKILANAYLVEGPTWAPNGSMLSYFKQDRSGKVRLYMIDIYTFKEWLVPTPTDASDPAWSPTLGAAQR